MVSNLLTFIVWLRMARLKFQQWRKESQWTHLSTKARLSRFCEDKLYARKISLQGLQKLIYLHLFVDCFMKISLQSCGVFQQIKSIHHSPFLYENSDFPTSYPETFLVPVSPTRARIDLEVLYYSRYFAWLNPSTLGGKWGVFSHRPKLCVTTAGFDFIWALYYLMTPVLIKDFGVMLDHTSYACKSPNQTSGHCQVWWYLQISTLIFL